MSHLTGPRKRSGTPQITCAEETETTPPDSQWANKLTVAFDIIQEKAPVGWGGRIRTYDTRYQKPLPYHLATPQQAGVTYAEPRLGSSPDAAKILYPIL